VQQVVRSKRQRLCCSIADAFHRMLRATVRHPVRLRLGGGEELAGRPGPVGAAGRHGHGGYPWRRSSPEEQRVLRERAASRRDAGQANCEPDHQ
jgi:hypothetical protein